VVEPKNTKQNVNSRMQDRAIKHAVYLERYGSTVTQEVVGYLNERVYPEILAKLEARLERIKLRGLDSGFLTTKRYVEMLEDIRSMLKDGHDKAHKILSGLMRELAKVEARWQESMVRDSIPKDARVVLMSDNAVNLRIVQQVVTQPIQGKPMNEWWDTLTRTTQDKITAEVGKGLSAGETADQIVRRVRGTQANGYRDGALNATREQAAAIVRTTSNHVTTQAREATYNEMDDVLKGVQWVATLDTKTCPVCGPLDGKVFKLNEGPRPPSHWNCRCTTAPVTKSFDEILKESKISTKKEAEVVSESTRASMDGQVPEAVTYDAWIKRQPAAVQNEVFGPARAKLLRAGKITTKDLVTRTGRLRSVDELLDS
jgi:SPP1 gp7 family putative phage head morphogenesis protein